MYGKKVLLCINFDIPLENVAPLKKEKTPKKLANFPIQKLQICIKWEKKDSVK